MFSETVLGINISHSLRTSMDSRQLRGHPLQVTEELRNACMEWQGEEPDPWLTLRQLQHEFLEMKLKVLIEKCQETQGEGCMPALLPESPEHKDMVLLSPTIEKHSRSLIHPPTAMKSPIYPRFRPVLVPIEEADASHKLDCTEEFKPGRAAQGEDDLQGLVLDEGRQDFDGQKKMLETAPNILCQEALREDLMTTCQPESSEQDSSLLSSTIEEHGRYLTHPPTTMKTPNGHHLRPVLVLIEEADASHKLDCTEEFKPGRAAQGEDDLQGLVLDEGRQYFDGQKKMLDTAPKIQCQEALREDLMTTCQPESSEQDSSLLSSNIEEHGRYLTNPPSTMKTRNGPHLRPVLVLVEEAENSNRLVCHEFKPVSAKQTGDDLENDVEVLFLEETNRQNCDGQNETLDPAPKTQRGWIRRLLSHFWKKKEDSEKAAKKHTIKALQAELQQLKEDKKIVKEIYRQEKRELKLKLKNAKKEWRLEKKHQKERQKEAKEGKKKCIS